MISPGPGSASRVGCDPDDLYRVKAIRAVCGRDPHCSMILRLSIDVRGRAASAIAIVRQFVRHAADVRCRLRCCSRASRPLKAATEQQGRKP